MTGISVYSLLENNRAAEEINIYLAGENISPENKKTINEMIQQYNRKFFYIDTDNICKRFEEQGVEKYKGKTYSTYLKHLIATEIKEPIERLLYMDSDTIVDGSLEELFSMPLEKPLYMGLDIMWDFYRAKLGLEKDWPYYNAGIILYNIPVWKKHNCPNRYWDFIKTQKKQYVLADQDITPILFGMNNNADGEIGILPLRYNYFRKKEALYSSIKEAKSIFYTAEEIEEASGAVSVYHCAKYRGERPWEKGNDHPFKPVFDRYNVKSPWSSFAFPEKHIPKHISIQLMLEKKMPKWMYIMVLRLAQRWYFFHEERKINKNII